MMVVPVAELNADSASKPTSGTTKSLRMADENECLSMLHATLCNPNAAPLNKVSYWVAPKPEPKAAPAKGAKPEPKAAPAKSSRKPAGGATLKRVAAEMQDAAEAEAQPEQQRRKMKPLASGPARGGAKPFPAPLPPHVPPAPLPVPPLAPPHVPPVGSLVSTTRTGDPASRTGTLIEFNDGASRRHGGPNKQCKVKFEGQAKCRWFAAAEVVLLTEKLEQEKQAKEQEKQAKEREAQEKAEQARAISNSPAFARARSAVSALSAPTDVGRGARARASRDAQGREEADRRAAIRCDHRKLHCISVSRLITSWISRPCMPCPRTTPNAQVFDTYRDCPRS